MWSINIWWIKRRGGGRKDTCIPKSFSPARWTTVALTWNQKAWKKYSYHGNHSSKIQNILQNCHGSLVGKGLVTPLCRPYLGSAVIIGQNTASDLFLLYGASFWESQPLQMPNLAPWIETTLRRTAVSDLRAPTVRWKTQTAQRNKNMKETNRRKVNKPLYNQPDLHKWDMGGG